MSDELRRTLRTVIQLVVGLAAGLPMLVDATGLEQTGGVAVALSVAAAVTRVMALPAVDAVLTKLGLGKSA